MGTRRLSREDWALAALDVMAAGGSAAVSIDRLARTLGATRGSFYWHFADRDELLRTAAETWEAAATRQIVERLAVVADPRVRLERLLAEAFGDDPADTRDADLVAVLGQEPAGSALAEVLARVTGERLGFLTTAFRDLGLPPAAARARAHLTYSAYLGWAQLRRAAPAEALTGRARTAALRLLGELVTAH